MSPLEISNYCSSDNVSTHVDELNSPIQDADQALKNAQGDVRSEVSRICFLLARDTACLPKHIDYRNDQTSKTDAAETVGQRATCCASGDALGRVTRAEIPGSVNARDDNMDGVLEPF